MNRLCIASLPNDRHTTSKSLNYDIGRGIRTAPKSLALSIPHML